MTIAAEPVSFAPPSFEPAPAAAMTPVPAPVSTPSAPPLSSTPSATLPSEPTLSAPSVPAPSEPTLSTPSAPRPSEPSAPASSAPARPAGLAALRTRTSALVVASRATPRRRVLVGVGLGLIAVLLLAGIGYAVWDRFYADPTRKAVAGHCLGGLPRVSSGEEPQVTKARIVPCNDPAATYLVEGRLDNVTEEQARDPQVCRGFRHATEIYRVVPPGGTGYVLCLSRTGE